MNIYLNNRPVHVLPTHLIGEGGEAQVYRLNPETVLALFKGANHSDFDGNQEMQKAVTLKLAELQHKLPAFPKKLPPTVVSPIDLARDDRGNIVGYTMQFLSNAEVLYRFAEHNFRIGMWHQHVVDIFKNLHRTVLSIHRKNVVIGDFNDLNVMVPSGTKTPYVIDAHSMQYKTPDGHQTYWCQLFTDGFVDPLLCDPTLDHLMLKRAHNENSDWYAYQIMLMRCLLLGAGPYSGVYKPANKANRILNSKRPLKRITVFHPEVTYPKNALPFGVLPDEILQHLEQTFVNDKRGEFPLSILETLSWTTCTICGQAHARSVCPHCITAPPGAVIQVIRGKVKATRVFNAPGPIVYVTQQHQSLKYLYHNGDGYVREDGRTVLSGPLQTGMRYRIQNDATLFARSNQLITINEDGLIKTTSVDQYQTLPVFDTNHANTFWVHQGVLYKQGLMGTNFRIGDVLHNQTLMWSGPTGGCGFYRAGNVTVGFVFDTNATGINDSVPPDLSNPVFLKT